MLAATARRKAASWSARNTATFLRNDSGVWVASWAGCVVTTVTADSLAAVATGQPRAASPGRGVTGCSVEPVTVAAIGTLHQGSTACHRGVRACLLYTSPSP